MFKLSNIKVCGKKGNVEISTMKANLGRVCLVGPCIFLPTEILPVMQYELDSLRIEYQDMVLGSSV